MMQQIGLPLKERFRWGGARRGAGRKRTGRAGVPHRARLAHSKHNPVHATLRLSRGLPSLRTRRTNEVTSAVGELIDGKRHRRAQHREAMRSKKG
jgi:hypothetical protein